MWAALLIATVTIPSDVATREAAHVTVQVPGDEAVADRPAPAKPRTRGAVGYATYYDRDFDGRVTASGVRFDADAMMAAHPTYPFGTVVRVTNLHNGSSTRVRIVDRGPSRGARRDGVIIDVSPAAARSLGFIRRGRARVRVDVLSSAPE